MLGQLEAEALQQAFLALQQKAAWSASWKQGKKYPLLVVHPKIIYSDILWGIILALKDSLVSWKLPDQLWFDIQKVC